MTLYISKKKHKRTNRNIKRKSITRNIRHRYTNRKTRHRYGGMDKERRMDKIKQSLVPNNPEAYELLKKLIEHPSAKLSLISNNSGYGCIFLLELTKLPDEYFIDVYERPVTKMIIKMGFYDDNKINQSLEFDYEDEYNKLKNHFSKYIASENDVTKEAMTQYKVYNAFPHNQVTFDVACVHLYNDKTEYNTFLDELSKKTSSSDNNCKNILAIIKYTLNHNHNIKLGIIAMDYANNYIESSHVIKQLVQLYSYKYDQETIKYCKEYAIAIMMNVFMKTGIINMDAHEGNFLSSIPNDLERKIGEPEKRKKYDRYDYRTWMIDAGYTIDHSNLANYKNGTYTSNKYNELTGRNYMNDYNFIKWVIEHWKAIEGENEFIPKDKRLPLLHLINTFIITINYVIGVPDHDEGVHDDDEGVPDDDEGDNESSLHRFAEYIIIPDTDYSSINGIYAPHITELNVLLNNIVAPESLIKPFWNGIDYPGVISNIQNINDEGIKEKYEGIYSSMIMIDPSLRTDDTPVQQIQVNLENNDQILNLPPNKKKHRRL